jgi:hypothetical protein
MMQSTAPTSRKSSLQMQAACLLAIGAATIASAADGAARDVPNGITWEVTGVTKLAELSIAPGALVTAPKGKSLTMTVNGVETAIQPGHFRGEVTLTPADDIDIVFDGMGTRQTYKYRTAIFVSNGAYLPGQSVAAAATGGSVTSKGADGVNINSLGANFNGIVIAGDSHYTIRNARIGLHGNGSNDFNGRGAAIRVGGSSNVTIDHAHITSTGAVRTAIWVGEHGVATINDSEIEVHDGTLPPDYGWSWTKPGSTNGDVMMEVPWMLGVRGNNRATLVVNSGTANYNNTRIRADGWGAISSDAAAGPGHGTVNLRNCRIETLNSGYGAYADNGQFVHASATVFDVPDYGLIMSGGSAVFTDRSIVNSRRIGVMAHDVTMPGGSSGTLTIDKGSVFNTEQAVIQLKSISPAITVDGATLNSRAGMILEVIDNDDPDRPATAGSSATEVNATFRNVQLRGDLVNSREHSGMQITFERATITGTISTAAATHALGPHGEKLVMQDAPDLYYLIGRQTYAHAPTDNAKGADIRLIGSQWNVNSTSYLTGLTIAADSRVVAPAGSQLAMSVNGVPTPIAPGTYRGRIVLTVSPGP